MKDEMKISTLQFTLIICSMLATTSQTSLPSVLAGVADQDAWLAYLIPIVYGCAVGAFFYILAVKFPGKNIFEIINILCGKLMGGVLNALLIIYFVIDLIAQTRLFTDFFSSSILERTPPELIILILTLLIIYYSTGTMEQLVRTNVIFLFLYLPIFFLLPILLMNEIDINKLEPVLGNGIMPSLKSGFLASVSFKDLLALGAFLHHVRKARDIYLSIKFGVILSACMLTVWNFCLISVLSPIFVSRMVFAGWILVQQIHITDFLDRVDLILFSLYMPLILIKHSVIFFAILTGLASYTKKKRISGNVMVGLLIAVLSAIAFDHTDEVILFNNYGLLPLTLMMQIILFGSLSLAAAVRRMSGGRLKLGKVEPITKQDRFGKFVWGSIIACGLSIIFGASFGSQNGWYGIAGGGLFCICLVLSAYFVMRQYGDTMVDDR